MSAKRKPSRIERLEHEIKSLTEEIKRLKALVGGQSEPERQIDRVGSKGWMGENWSPAENGRAPSPNWAGYGWL
jgi:hypothetical protein